MSLTPDGSFRPGLATTAWLAGVGITRIDEVARLGVIPVCRLLRTAGHPVSFNLARGLQADLMGTAWDRLPDRVVARLRTDYDAAMRAISRNSPARSMPRRASRR